MYEQILLNALRYLGINEFKEIKRMSLREYELRMTACQLRMLDDRQKIYEQAWANQQVQATKKSGKKSIPVYDTFEKFFNYKKFEQEILGHREKEDRLLTGLFKKANS
ncbi:hypothetical protein [Melissococcus plutonius]|nr:hypothetical protein [Melissococcus plutonius]AIM25227.1 hypothetical protein MEPL_c013580 [Melissococcus plutonius S1]KMT23877.1 hypothetical protein MEPL2_3c00800 [Melissococcus plutonius]KMT24400.1 hypothetical protein MEPL3_6c00800 [Melissococcus plutonius]KMT25973.1 hypothetical protein MEPL1_6c00800 [Melissococcus plutonius]KMT28523.1 hypothetical protein MEPL4_5c00800 [Melissococcus plutonius]